MDEVDDVVAAARALAVETVGLAADALLRDADVERVQRHYVAPALRHLADAEVHAVLAAGGDHEALRVLEQLVVALRELRDELRTELPGQEDGGDADV